MWGYCMQAIHKKTQDLGDAGLEVLMGTARGQLIDAPQFEVEFVPGVEDWHPDEPVLRAVSDPLRLADVFDTMKAKARARGADLCLTESQIAMGRVYAQLIERQTAGGIKLSSFEGSSGGGGDADAFTQARLDASRLIDRLRYRIGDGVAMPIRRIRPSERGSRVQIKDRDLVDLVCLAGKDMSAVLRAHGWNVDGKTVQAATRALGAALERMQGPSVPQRPDVLRCGSAPVWPYRK